MGKSQLSRRLQERTGLNWIDVSKFAHEKKCLEEFDPEYNCPVLDEDKVINLFL